MHLDLKKRFAALPYLKGPPLHNLFVTIQLSITINKKNKLLQGIIAFLHSTSHAFASRNMAI